MWWKFLCQGNKQSNCCQLVKYLDTQLRNPYWYITYATFNTIKSGFLCLPVAEIFAFPVAEITGFPAMDPHEVLLTLIVACTCGISHVQWATKVMTPASMHFLWENHDFCGPLYFLPCTHTFLLVLSLLIIDSPPHHSAHTWCLYPQGKSRIRERRNVSPKSGIIRVNNPTGKEEDPWKGWKLSLKKTWFALSKNRSTLHRSGLIWEIKK